MRKNTDPQGELPPINSLSLTDFRMLDPNTRGRIVAREIQDIATTGQKIAPNLQRCLDRNDYLELARLLDRQLEKERTELIRKFGKPFTGGEWPETAQLALDLGEPTVVTREQIEQAQGENVVDLLQSMGIMDRGF